MASGFAGLQWYFSITKKYFTSESLTAASPSTFKPLSGFHRFINLSTPSKIRPPDD
jgi:hypothetical protein